MGSGACFRATRLQVPPDVWRAVSGGPGARPRRLSRPQLGCTSDEAKATAGAGFDYLFTRFACGPKAPWSIENYSPAARRTLDAFRKPDMAPSRTAGDSPDDPAARLNPLRAVRRSSRPRLMPIGYSVAPARLHVVETSPDQREHDTAVNLSTSSRAINRLPPNCVRELEGAHGPFGAGTALVALLRFAPHPAAARPPPSSSATLRQPSRSSCPLLARTEFSAVRDRPRRAALVLSWQSLTLAPYAVRIFAAQPRGCPSRGAAVRTATLGASSSNRVAGDRRLPLPRSFSCWPVSSLGRHLHGRPRELSAAGLPVPATAEWRRTPCASPTRRLVGVFPSSATALRFTIVAWRSFLSGADGSARTAAVERAGKPAMAVRPRRRTASRATVAAGLLCRSFCVRLKRRGRPEAQLKCCLRVHEFPLPHAERRTCPATSDARSRRAPRCALLPLVHLFHRSSIRASRPPRNLATMSSSASQLEGPRLHVLYFTPIHPIGRNNRQVQEHSPRPSRVRSASSSHLAEEGGQQVPASRARHLRGFRRMWAAHFARA